MPPRILFLNVAFWCIYLTPNPVKSLFDTILTQYIEYASRTYIAIPFVSTQTATATATATVERTNETEKENKKE